MMVEKENHPQLVYPATVVEVIGEYKAVINRGSEHGVSRGDEFIIYVLSKDPIIDPTNGETLGYLEYVKGRGEVSHVQEKMSTIESNEELEAKRVVSSSSWNPFDQQTDIKFKMRKFRNVRIGDLAKPV